MREKYFILARQINTRKHHGDISILKLKTGRRRFTRGEISENNLITELKLRPHEISSKLLLRLVVVDQENQNFNIVFLVTSTYPGYESCKV